MPGYPATAGPDPLDPTLPRMHLDDDNLPSGTTLAAEPNLNAGKHTMTHENAYRAAMLAEARIAYGWVQAPSGLDGSTPTTWALSADAVNPSGNNPTQNLDTLSEAVYTATGDISWLARGHKVKSANTYGIVTWISGQNVAFLGPNVAGFANRFGTWAGQGHFTPTPTMWYSAARAPAGFPTNPMVWASIITSPITGGAKPDGTAQQVLLNPAGDTGWKTWDTQPNTDPPHWLMRLPIGDWEIEFFALVQVDRATAGDMTVQIGIALNGGVGGTDNNVAAAPDGDLLWDAYIPAGGTTPLARVSAHMHAARTVTAQMMSPQFGLWGKIKSGTGSRVFLCNDVRPTVMRARCTLL